MKDKIILLLTIILFSCSSDDNPITEPQEEQFAVELVATSTNVNIDEVATFEVKTSKHSNIKKPRSLRTRFCNQSDFV